MTLNEMHPGDTGVMLTVPKYLANLQLSPGKRVRLITVRDGLSLIEACGMRLALSPTLAAQMILATYYE